MLMPSQKWLSTAKDGGWLAACSELRKTVLLQKDIDPTIYDTALITANSKPLSETGTKDVWWLNLASGMQVPIPKGKYKTELKD